MMATSTPVLGGCFSPTGTELPSETASSELTGSSETSSSTSENTSDSDSTAASPSSAASSSEDSGSASSAGGFCGDGDLDADAGEECDPLVSPNCSDQCMKTFRRVFITSESYSGALGGIVGANEKCQTAANASNLNGVFHAWLSSTESSPAASFVKSNVPYRDLLDHEIAADWNGLISEDLKSGIYTTEEMDEPEPGVHPCMPALVVVWSDTKPSGVLTDPAFACMDWQTSEGNGRLGAGGYVDVAWSDGCIAPCNIKAHLYCFEQ